ncbi:MAG: fibronectin type III domain-containing protein, partial [Ignavibacteriales bacterium]|nr:fibronectin type III domain-containing protein [Ignavibacteriales bacterium]
ISGLIDEIRISNIARSPSEFNLQLPPVNLVATPSGTTINLNWQNGGGAVPLMRYRIYRGADSTTLSLIDSTTSTSYANSGLAEATYFYRVSAVDSTGFEGATSYAASATITGEPPIPILASPADSAVNQNTRPTLTWNASTGAIKYHLQVSQSPTFSTTVFDDTTITTTSRQVGPLQNNRTHYWRVRGGNTSGWSNYSSVFMFSTSLPPSFSSISIRNSFTSPGSRPTGLAWNGRNLWMIDNLKNVYKLDTSGTVLSSFAVSGFPDNDLSWDGTGLWIGDGAVGTPFDHVKVDSVGNRVDSLDAYYWANSGLEWDGKFFWVGDYNFSVLHKHRKDGSKVLDFSTSAIFGHPTGLSYDGVNLWVGTSAEGGNDIFKYSTTGTALYQFDLSTLGISPTPGSFASVAWDGQSLWYAPDDQFTIYRLNVPYYHSPPSVPVLVSPLNSLSPAVPTDVTLTWNRSLDATSYRVQLATAANFLSGLIVNDSTVVDSVRAVSNLSTGTTYYWRVNAKNSGGTSAYSVVFSFETSDTIAPVETDLYKYDIYGDTSPGPTTIVSSTAGPETTLTVTALTNGITYYFRATAVDQSNNVSTYSNEVAAIPQLPPLLGEYTNDANTVLLLHMNEPSGSTVSDASSYSNNGTASGTTIVDGRFGKARNFNGDPDRILIPQNGQFNPGSGFTVEAWVNYNPFPSNVSYGVSNDEAFSLMVSPESGSKARATFRLALNPYGSAFVDAIAPNSFDVQQWHHLAGVVSGATAYIYVDGVLRGAAPITGTLNSTTMDLIVGARGTLDYYRGQVDEVRISNIARSPNQFNLQLPPRNLSASVSGTTINLSWQNGGGMVPLMRYKIYRGADSTNVTVQDSSTSASFQNSGLNPTTTYFYRISAVDSTGFESAMSYAASATTGSGGGSAPSAPTAQSATNVAQTSFTANWSSVGTATGYRLDVSISSSFASYISGYQDLDVGNVVSSNVTGLSQSTNYYYRVRAYNASGTSTNSGTINVTTSASGDVTAPGSPINPTINPNTWSNSPSFTISWTNPSDPSGIAKAWYRLNSIPTSGTPGIETNISGSSFPISVSQGTTSIYFYLADGAGNKNPASAVSVIAKFDNVKPTVSDDSINVDPFNTGSPQSIGISATASDLTSGVESLRLEYRRAGTNWISSQSQEYLSPNGGTALIPEPFLSDNKNFGVDYRIVAEDSAGNKSYTPTHSVQIRITQASNPRTDASGNNVTQPSVGSLPSGNDAQLAYRMFSVPLNLDNKRPDDVFETKTGLGAYDQKVWRFFKLNNARNDFDEYPTFSNDTVITPGRAFLLILKSGAVVKVGSGSIPKAEDYAKTGIPLLAGYNFIGNPFNFTVPIESLSVDNGSYTMWEFVGENDTETPKDGWRSNPPNLKAWEGIVININTPSTLRFNITDRPGSAAFPDGNIAKAYGTTSKKITWSMRLKARRLDGGLPDDENVIGLAEGAVSGADEFDMFEHPLVGDRSVLLSFTNDEGVLTHDFRGVGEEGYVWDFKLITPDENAKVKLFFEGLSDAPSEVHLLDLDTKMPHRLNAESRLEVNTFKGQRNFRLIVGSLEFAKKHNNGIDLVPKEFALYQNYPNPFNPETVIRYSLPNASFVYKVSLKVYNLLGQEVARLVEAEQSSGFYEAKHEGRNLTTGAYFYRFVVSGESKESSYTSVKRMMLMK